VTKGWEKKNKKKEETKEGQVQPTVVLEKAPKKTRQDRKKDKKEQQARP
jgi:hypothetical protein